MILLLNVKITSQGLSHYERASWLPKYDRLDIFKYCLASYAALLPLVDRCEFFIELAPEFSHRYDELNEYIRSLYPEDKLSLHWYRHYYCRDWRKWCDDNLDDPDELIWFAGNDDHIFLDYSLDLLESGLNHLTNDSNGLSQLYYSHWPEQIRLSYHQAGTITNDSNYIVRSWRTFDAITIMKATRWRCYWFDQDWADMPVFRTDALWHAGYELTGPVYIPTRELVRHYDGYSHVGSLANISPPLFIPPKFFQAQMKIRCGYDDRDNDCVNINPTSEWLYAFNSTGTDYRMVVADIPLFWKGRIQSTDLAYRNDLKILTDARNAAFLASTRIPLTTYSVTFDEQSPSIPVDWVKHHLRGK